MTINCAYCGQTITRREREHVIPKCLYPKTQVSSKVQRITVPTCRSCNASWADDEAHFRNVLNISGEPNAAAKEIWKTTRRGFTKLDGNRRLLDLIQLLHPVKINGQNRNMIYPGNDPRVLRIIRKITRGLCRFHNVDNAVDERRIKADILKHIVPDAFLENMPLRNCDPDIFQYRFQVLNQVGIHSFWLLTFFNRTTFYSLVEESMGSMI